MFVARPVSQATSEDERFACAVERVITDSGLFVRLGGSSRPGQSDADVATENIAAVTEAASLVVILPECSAPPSSVWLELGMALVASRPMVIVARKHTDLPFLVRASAAARPDLIEILNVSSSAAETAQRVLTALTKVSPSST